MKKKIHWTYNRYDSHHLRPSWSEILGQPGYVNWSILTGPWFANAKPDVHTFIPELHNQIIQYVEMELKNAGIDPSTIQSYRR